MSITVTLFGQMITFAILVWFINRFLWGPMTKMMADRSQRISEGLMAAERGKREQELAQQRAKEVLQDAKHQAEEIVKQAQRRALDIIEEAKGAARQESEQLLTGAKSEILRETHRAKELLRGEVARLVISGTEQILQKEIDASAHAKLLDDLVARL